MGNDADAMPDSININAWTGDPEDSAGAFSAESLAWGLRPSSGGRQTLSYHAPEPRNPTDEQVGWGLVIAHRPGFTPAQNAALQDMPQSVRDLVAARRGVVLGWDKANGIGHLTRYLPDDTTRKVAIDDVPRGTAPNALPRYLVLLGGPDQLPWLLQYRLNLSAAVGRLDLDEDGLNNYAAAAVAGWSAPPDPGRCVLWSVDEGGTDITAIMRQTVADPLLRALQADADIGAKAQVLAGPRVTHAELIARLSAAKPMLVVTTSHGQTGPIADPTAMRRDLGLPVDGEKRTLPIPDLLAAWEPDGAIWYAHACCSAGCDTGTVFGGLFKPATRLPQTLEAIGRLGAQSASLPRALLGAKKPARAFIGHVEPTFDWTLRNADASQALTLTLTAALYQNLFDRQPKPVGLAFGPYYQHVGVLFNQWYDARKGAERLEAGAELNALRAQVCALDRRSLVLHGDPAAVFSALTQ